MADDVKNTFSLAFPRALGEPAWSAGFRREFEDFRVDEELGFEPSGEGEHFLVRIRKTNQNTRWLAGWLAQACGVDESAVGYCGLKDRRAITSQWFSIQLPGTAAPSLPASPGIEVLARTRHHRKLRPGMHRGNGFVIRLRDLECDRDALAARLEMVAGEGVPNYFGEQRFGIGGGNLVEAAAIVARRSPRFRGRRGGLYLSAARSWLFNQVLAARVSDGTWNRPLAGEESGHPRGPLWGRGRNPAPGAVAELEAAVLSSWQSWCEALEHSGLSQERRDLILVPGDFRWQWQGRDLELAFSLPPGTYATAVLRELARLKAPEPALAVEP
jgi:tRNA pseudouridine13 synthase